MSTRIARLEARLYRVPFATPLWVGAELPGRLADAVDLILVKLETQAGHSGLGMTYTLCGGTQAVLALLRDDLAPLVIGEDALAHEKLFAKAHALGHILGWSGLLKRAYAAIDLALWDLKGQVTGLPVHRLLGAGKMSASVVVSGVAGLGVPIKEVTRTLKKHLGDGKIMGVLVQLGTGDPDADIERVHQIREAIGSSVWLGVTAEERYEPAIALAVGQYLAEEYGIDWLESPIAASNFDGHRRLAEQLDVPIAAGASLAELADFERLLHHGVRVLRPDVLRLGGVTPWLKVDALAERHDIPVVPYRLPEIGLHLACGLQGVPFVEDVPWFSELLLGPEFVERRLTPADRPGWGLEPHAEALAKLAVGGGAA